MNEIILLPFLVALCASILFSYLFEVFTNANADLKFRKARANSFRRQFVYPKKLGRKAVKGMVKFDLEVTELTNSIIKAQYRNLLQRLIDRSGSRGDLALRKLLRTKFYAIAVGVLLSFAISIESQYQLLPITLGFSLVAYFVPNLLKSVGKLSTSNYGRRLSTLIAFQGVTKMSTIKLFRLKFYSAIAVFTICYLYTILTQAAYSKVFYFTLLTIFGFFLPDIFLYNRVMKRRERFEQLFPDAIDLLSMCVNAGLAFPSALAKVSESQQGPVAEELARVNAEVSLGKDRVEALREMASRVNLESVQEFVGSVSQVDRFGIPISRALAEQSRELRAKRKTLGREKAQKVPIKILGPIMLCFLPCVILIVLAPAIIGVLNVL